MNNSNTKYNSMIKETASLFFSVLLEHIPPYWLSLYLIECLCTVVCPCTSVLVGR